MNDTLANWNIEEYEEFLNNLPQEYIQAFEEENND